MASVPTVWAEKLTPFFFRACRVQRTLSQTPCPGYFHDFLGVDKFGKKKTVGANSSALKVVPQAGTSLSLRFYRGRFNPAIAPEHGTQPKPVPRPRPSHPPTACPTQLIPGLAGCGGSVRCGAE